VKVIVADFGIDDGDECRDEVVIIAAGHGGEIRRRSRIETGRERPAQQVLHAQRGDDGGGPMAGGIGDHQSQPVRIDRDRVPPITGEHPLRRGTRAR